MGSHGVGARGVTGGLVVVAVGLGVAGLAAVWVLAQVRAQGRVLEASPGLIGTVLVIGLAGLLVAVGTILAHTVAPPLVAAWLAMPMRDATVRDVGLVGLGLVILHRLLH